MYPSESALSHPSISREGNFFWEGITAPNKNKNSVITSSSSEHLTRDQTLLSTVGASSDPSRPRPCQPSEHPLHVVHFIHTDEKALPSHFPREETEAKGDEACSGRSLGRQPACRFEPTSLTSMTHGVMCLPLLCRWSQTSVLGCSSEGFSSAGVVSSHGPVNTLTPAARLHPSSSLPRGVGAAGVAVDEVSTFAEGYLKHGRADSLLGCACGRGAG